MESKPRNIPDWLYQYERYISAVNSRSTQRRYGPVLHRFFSRLNDWRRKRVEDVDRLDVHDYQLMRQQEGASPRTIDLEVAIVRAFFNWAIEVGDIPTYNPAARWKSLHKTSGEQVSSGKAA